ncbi:Heat shock transcription factor [Quillaja saponaria]|uniref:Heat shock transcription factor n=1 Tax=Quillaja saponaria TaxID=32244 RepID=A0AAD7QJG1_QUISA|nr:Heat shock transcription factor [Quillaja saponaria]
MDRVQSASSIMNSGMGSMASGNSVPPFLSKTYDMVDDPSTNSVVSWSDSNNSFVVWNVPEFSRELLPKHFKHSNFSSFVRQLNTYGFRKVDPDRWEFANEGFLRGQKHLLKNINRRKPAHVNSYQQQAQVQNSSVGACVEVGKFGLDEEVERLKRDKNVLMQELVRLRQQQQATDHQLQSVGQRVQVMEQRQQQMMSFLAKAMQSPGFLSQFVQQQNENNRNIGGVSKKRRLQGQEEDSLTSGHHNNALNGRIVKYQPSMNEAAKALLREILQMNDSAKMESLINNPDAFLIDDVPSASASDNGSSSSQVSGVTLSEVPPTSGQSFVSVEPQVPVSCPSNSIPEMHSSPTVLTDSVKAAEFLELELHNSENVVLPDFSEVQGMMPESSCVNTDVNLMGSETENAVDIYTMTANLDGTLPVETDAFSPSSEMDGLLDGIPKLPSINDVFWEQFLTTSPLIGDTDETNSSSLDGMAEDQELHCGKENGWANMAKNQHMDHITEQMGLLSSVNRRG